MVNFAFRVSDAGTRHSKVTGLSTQVPERREYRVIDVVPRVRAEYDEMPGLALTAAQAARLFQIDHDVCVEILGACVDAGFLRESGGRFIRA